MSMQTDVRSNHLTASGVVFAARTRLKAFSCVGTTVAGVLQFRDGGASGPILCEVDIPANTNVNSFYTLIPGEGILFSTSIYATLTNIGAVTAYFG